MRTRSSTLHSATLGALVLCAFTTALEAQAAPRAGSAQGRRSSCAPAPAPAAGDLELNPIKPDSDIPSRGSQKPTAVTFINGSCDTVSIVWVDYYGGRKRYKTLAPGATYQQQTFDDNTWVIEMADSSRAVGFFRSAVTPARAVIRSRGPAAGR